MTVTLVVAEYCRCGGQLTGRVRGSARAVRDVHLSRLFWAVHDADGCGQTDKATCAGARRKWKAAGGAA